MLYPFSGLDGLGGPFCFAHFDEVIRAFREDFRGSPYHKDELEMTRSAELGHHAVISRVAEGNEASRRMHENAGFSYVGAMSEVGRKFGRWLDVHIYQKLVHGPGGGA
jgi:phosphinothricin acetyltransferase